jgi:hypothetical protein
MSFLPVFPAEPRARRGEPPREGAMDLDVLFWAALTWLVMLGAPVGLMLLVAL